MEVRNLSKKEKKVGIAANPIRLIVKNIINESLNYTTN